MWSAHPAKLTISCRCPPTWVTGSQSSSFWLRSLLGPSLLGLLIYIMCLLDAPSAFCKLRLILSHSCTRLWIEFLRDLRYISRRRSALMSFPVTGWKSEALEEAAQILGNMSSVALVMKQYTTTLAYIELLQSVAEGSDCMRWSNDKVEPYNLSNIIVKSGKAWKVWRTETEVL